MIDRIRTCMATSLKLDAATAARITESSTAADVPGWTSVAHLSLILELERTFNVQFGNDEIASLGSVRAIIAALARKGVR
jgi:acyl carrier protein